MIRGQRKGARGEKESVIHNILSSEEMSGKGFGVHVDNSSEYVIDSDHNVIGWELDFVQNEGVRWKWNKSEENLVWEGYRNEVNDNLRIFVQGLKHDCN